MPSPMPTNSYGGYGGPPPGGMHPGMGRQSRASPGPGMGNRAAPGISTRKYQILKPTFYLFGPKILGQYARIVVTNIFSYSTSTIWRCSTTSAE